MDFFAEKYYTSVKPFWEAENLGYLKAVGSGKDICNDEDTKDFLDCISDLVDDKKVLEMKNFTHHFSVTCYQHCLNVSYYNYKICKALGWNAREAARGGLLHDLFLYDWHRKRLKNAPFHATNHGRVALANALSEFTLTDREQNIIASHMFPVANVMPKYKESFVITLVDKYCAIAEWLQRMRDFDIFKRLTSGSFACKLAAVAVVLFIR